MKKFLWVFIGFWLVLGILFIRQPVSYGYGDSCNSATILSPGETSFTLYAAVDDYAYFKIYCETGDSLAITLTFSASFDLNLFLYSPTGGLIDSSESETGIIETVEHTYTQSGYYCIFIYVWDGPYQDCSCILNTVLDHDPGGGEESEIGLNNLFLILGIIGLIELISYFQKKIDRQKELPT